MGYILTTAREHYKRVDPLSFYTEKKFQQRYRLSKAVVRVLVKNYVSTLKTKVLRGVHAVPHRIRFCVALRYFATGSNYTVIADCHGVSKSSVCRAVQDISDYFRDHLADYVHWPDTDTEKANIAYKWWKKTKKPKLFGLVDGTHIPIACPRGITKDENQFWCYKGYYSINAMIVCDFDGLITHVNAANPGSSNDIYVMNGSQLKFLGERNDFHGYYLLGDSGYVLTDYLLIPLRVEYTQADVRYNKWHKRTRSQVERVIGHLKQRWRCLDTSGGYLFHDPQRAAAIVETCCALHNCAKVSGDKIRADFASKDGFVRCQDEVEQPVNGGVKPREKFVNIRKDFITANFGANRR